MDKTSIILLAHGKMGYGRAAMNMAMSIKYHGTKTPVVLFAEQRTMAGIDLKVFDKVIWINEAFYLHKEKRSVALSKINLLDNLPSENNLYLDVDGMCLRNLDPLIEALIDSGKFYATQVMGSGKKGDSISYDCWATHDMAWSFFNLDDHATWRTIQSSWAFFKKGDQCRDLFKGLTYYHNKGFGVNNLKEKWAPDQIPDELLFQGMCARSDYDPSFEPSPIFFGDTHVVGAVSDLSKKYYLLSMYGQGGIAGRTQVKRDYLEWYSRVMKMMSTEMGLPYFKQEQIMNDKILNEWKTRTR